MATATLDLNISGMTCAACQANVQRALKRQPGVADASVNLMTGQAQVVFDPALIQPPQLVSAVETIGYGADLPSRERSAVEEQEARDRAQAEEFRALVRKALFTGAAGALAMAAMPLMHLSRGAFNWILLVATVVVMATSGRGLYVRGFRALRHGVPDMNSLVAVGTGAAFLYSLVATA
jgi:Cu+-exporting ATPase